MIEHLGIWVDDIEVMREFYLTYFDVVCREKYFNPTKNFTSCFIAFNEGDCRIELMHRPDIADNTESRGTVKGMAHFAIFLSGKAKVDVLTKKLREDGYKIVSEPRMTGDGYYESVVLDPEGNCIELTS